MSDDVVHVHLNEGPPQVFRATDNCSEEWWTHPVPRATWDALAAAETAAQAANAALTVALQGVLKAIQAAAPPDDNVHEYVVDGDRLYWP